MDRVNSGIYGLDELLEGGFPKGRTILVSGACGTGKTIFAMQFAYRGAMEFDEPAVYLTLDERPDMLRNDMLRFGWDIEKAEKKGKFVLIDASSTKIGRASEEKYYIPQTEIDVDRLLLKLMQIIDQIGAKRVIIDGIAGLGTHFNSESEIRKTVLKISYMLMKSNVTTLITSEVPEISQTANHVSFSKYGIEEYIADGVIIMHYIGLGTETNRTMFIRKMRGTKHGEDVLPMEFSPKGIIVKSPEEAYKI